jgi:serine/threonine protein kinase/Tol biopolymer transport system component
VQITSGARLGPYEVLELLGRGGMGQVYRAHDSRLHRDVALKIIHAELTDEEHLVRFRREARSLAALSHPNVASVYDLDEVDETTFLVMELVGGPTLAERLASGRLPIEDAIRIAIQVAAALEAVHDKGITHRDLKPANIKLAPDGTVKVLDFGLAKAAVPRTTQHSHLATVPFDDTREGLIVGTAAYMSPEQARGLDVDRRTDVWAFGCVLYEMLTGRPAFAAATIADTIAAVLERDPDWSALPRETPTTTTRLLRRCLQRDLARRLRDIGDAALDLQDSAVDYASSAVALPYVPRRRRLPALAASAALAAAVLLGAVAMWILQPSALPSNRPTRFTVPLPTTAQLAGLDFPSVAFAPNGAHLVYVGRRGGQTQLFLRAMNALEPTPLAGTTNAVAPFFSPDGRSIAFFADGQLKKIAVSGGTPISICDAQVGLGGSWSSDDMIVFASSTGSGLSQVPASGGTPRRVTSLDVPKGEFSHRWPEWLPDGKTILYTIGTVGSWNDAQIVAESLTGERAVLVQGGTNPRYLRSGHLLYAQNGRVMMVPFDVRRLSVTGPAAPVLENVVQSSDGAAQFAVSLSGDVAYVAGSLDSGQRRLVSVGRDGAVTPFAAPLRPYASPRVSPDGRTLLLVMELSPPDLWTYDIQTGGLTQLTFAAGATAPVWAPDGRQAAFSSTRSGVPNVFLMDMGQNGPAERIAANDHAQIPGSWAPDQPMLAFVERRPATGRDILLLPLRDGRVPRPLLTSAADESAPRISPDGRWLAYVTNQSGRTEVSLRRLMGTERPQQVSMNGGIEPVWAPSGLELFYREGDKMMAVPVDGNLRSQPRTLFSGEFARGTLDSPNYDLMPDGQRFVMIQRQPETAEQPTLHVLTNWFDTPRAALGP